MIFISSVELIFPLQQFVVPVQQNLTDWGLRVPMLTPVEKWESHAHFLCFKNLTGFTWRCRSLDHPPHLLTHHIHEYLVNIWWISVSLRSFCGAKGGRDNVLERKTRHDRYISKLWSTHVLEANANACCVCCVCCPKLVVNRNWWCGVSQTLALLHDVSSCVP